MAPDGALKMLNYDLVAAYLDDVVLGKVGGEAESLGTEFAKFVHLPFAYLPAQSGKKQE